MINFFWFPKIIKKRIFSLNNTFELFLIFFLIFAENSSCVNIFYRRSVLLVLKVTQWSKQAEHGKTFRAPARLQGPTSQFPRCPSFLRGRRRRYRASYVAADVRCGTFGSALKVAGKLINLVCGFFYGWPRSSMSIQHAA